MTEDLDRVQNGGSLRLVVQEEGKRYEHLLERIDGAWTLFTKVYRQGKLAYVESSGPHTTERLVAILQLDKDTYGQGKEN